MGEENQDQAPVARRGEAAWKANLERIAEKNAKVKKEARQVREAYERKMDGRRRLRELRQSGGNPDA